MGVTGIPYDFSAEAIEATLTFISDNTDMVAVKFDEGIPWEEAFQNRNTYTEGFEKSFADKSKFPKEKKVFLSVTPLNKDKNAMAGYRDAGENSPNPEPWGRKDFDDAMVAKAYLNFCKEMIRRFRPDYFAYGIEVNTLAKTPGKWKKFVPFIRDIYIALKKDHPQLPLILTFSTEGVTWDQDQAPAQRKAIQEVVPFTDLMAVTAMPYIKEQNPAKIGKNYFQQMAALRDRRDGLPGGGRELHRHRARRQGRLAAGLPALLLRGGREAQREVHRLDGAPRPRPARRKSAPAAQRVLQAVQGHRPDRWRGETAQVLRALEPVAQIHPRRQVRTATAGPQRIAASIRPRPEPRS
jgi:hypothetical protein